MGRLALSNQPGCFFVYCRTSTASRRNVQIKISSALEKWRDQHLFSMFLVPCSSITPADPLTWAQSEFTDQTRGGEWVKGLSHVGKKAASDRRGHSGPSPHSVSFQDILCYDLMMFQAGFQIPARSEWQESSITISSPLELLHPKVVQHLDDPWLM